MAEVRTDYRIALKDDFSRGLAGMRSQVNSFNVSLKNISAGLAVGAGAFAAMIKSSANLADELGKSAQRAGVTVETFSALRYGAKLADVDITQLEGGLAKLGRSMAEAAQGGKEAREAFAALGVSFANVDGTLRGTADVFRDVAERLSKLPDGATKTALAMQVFGRAGAQLIPLLNGGAEGIAEFTREAERMALIVSTETAKAAEEFNDNLTRMQEAISGVAQAMSKDLIKGLAELSSEFLRAYQEGEGLLRVFTALGSAASRVSSGTDQKRMGELLLQQIELERRVLAFGDEKGPLANRARESLARVTREIEGLKAVMRPEEFGAAPARVTTPAARPDIVLTDSAKEAEAQVTAAKKAKEARKAITDEVRRHQSALGDTLQMIDEEAQAWQALDDRRTAARQAVETGQERALRELDEYLRLFGANSEEYGRKAIEVFNELNPEIEKTSEAARDLALTMTSAFSEAIVSGSSLSDVLKGLGRDLLQIGLRETLLKPGQKLLEGLFSGAQSGSAGSGGGILDFFKGLFPNDRGGLYKVGGSSGEHPIAFTARAGEYVAVGTGAQQGGGWTINVNNNAGANVRPSVNPDTRTIDISIDAALSRRMNSGASARTTGLVPALVGR